MDRFRVLILSLGLFAFTSAAIAPRAHAMRTRSILVRSATYGTAAGLAAGLVSWPVAKSANTLIAGAAVRLVLGLGYGYYRIQERDRIQEEMSASLRARERGYDPALRGPAGVFPFGTGLSPGARAKGNGAGVFLAAPIYSF